MSPFAKLDIIFMVSVALFARATEVEASVLNEKKFKISMKSISYSLEI